MLDDSDQPKAASIYYQESLSLAYKLYGSILNEGFLSSSWGHTYIAKTPCVSRLIARDVFLTEQLPKIQNEIRQLQQNKG